MLIKGRPREAHTSNFRNNKSKCIFNQHIRKVCDIYSWRCYVTVEPISTRLAPRWCPCLSVLPGAMCASRTRVIEGRRVSSKNPSWVWDQDCRFAWRNRRKKCFPNEGLFICPPGKSMIFCPSGRPNIWLTATSLVAQNAAKAAERLCCQDYPLSIFHSFLAISLFL